MTTLSADLYSNKAVIVTQDGDLITGQIVYVVGVEKKNAFLMVHRFCILQVDKYHEYSLTYGTLEKSETIHIPFNILNIANYKINKQVEEKYHFL